MRVEGARDAGETRARDGSERANGGADAGAAGGCGDVRVQQPVMIYLEGSAACRCTELRSQ